MTDIIVEPQSLKEKVQNGANYLDQKIPDWASKIDVYSLNMRNMKQCVLGQLYGDFGIALRTFNECWNWIPENGFILETTENFKTKYLALTEIWRTEIENRTKIQNQTGS